MAEGKKTERSLKIPKRKNIKPKLPKPKRIGEFEIPFEIIKDYKEFNLCALFGQMIVLRAEALYARDVIRYTAFSDLFDITPDGGCAKFYMFTWNGKLKMWELSS